MPTKKQLESARQRREQPAESSIYNGNADLNDLASWGETSANMIPSNALVRREDGTIIYGDFTLTRMGIQHDGLLDENQWQNLGIILTRLNESIQWYLGDWLLFAPGKWGEMYDELSEMTGVDKRVLKNYKWIASCFELSSRNDNLSWSHYRVIATYAPRDQWLHWINVAASEGLSKRALTDQIRASHADAASSTPVMKAHYAANQNYTLLYHAAKNGNLEAREALETIYREVRELLDSLQTEDV